MIKSSLLSAAVLTGALYVCPADARATAYSIAKLSDVNYSVFDANPSDMLGLAFRDSDAYRENAASVHFSSPQDTWQITKKLIGGEAESGFIERGHGGRALSRDRELSSFAYSSGLTESVPSAFAANARFAVWGLTIGPGTGVTLEALYSFVVRTDQDYLDSATEYEHSEAFYQIGISVSSSPDQGWTSDRQFFQKYEETFMVPRLVYLGDGRWGRASYSQELLPKRVELSYVNNSNVWQWISLHGFVSALTASSIPLKESPTPVPDGMNTALGGLLAFGVLAFVRRRG